MIVFLRFLFLVVLGTMLWVTSWASYRCPLFAVPPSVAHHPWFLATMADAYWGFTTFFVWVCFKNTAWTAKASWLVAIALLGNIAMSSYCLRELFRVPARSGVSEVLTSRRPGVDLLGAGLAVAGAVVVAIAWKTS